MNVRLCLVVLLCASGSPIYARLGETEAQSQQRYGQVRAELIRAGEKPLMAGAVERAYEYEGWRVRAAFVEGSCVRIEYAHIPEGGVPKPITEQEAKAILEAEKGKFSWREDKLPRTPGAAGELEKALKGALNLRRWERSDRANAEMALGLVLKLETRSADEMEKRLARKGPDKAPAPAGGKAPPKF
jgi:hypothetical protein